MGYRSEVYIKFKAEHKDEFDAILKEYDLEDAIKQEDINEEPTQQDDGYVRYYGDWLKWYDSYKDVQAIEKFLYSVNGGLLAIGEDNNVFGFNQYETDMFVLTQVDW